MSANGPTHVSGLHYDLSRDLSDLQANGREFACGEYHNFPIVIKHNVETPDLTNTKSKCECGDLHGTSSMQSQTLYPNE